MNTRTSRKPLKTLGFRGFSLCSENEGIPPYLNKFGGFWETNAKKAFLQRGFSLFFSAKKHNTKVSGKETKHPK